MAEIVGTTIGVVGLLGQLFDGCVKAYGFFTTARHLDSDGQRLMCKVRIEEMRLVVWGREWGVAEGRLEAHLDSGRNPQLRALAVQILGQLHDTVADCRILREKYGLVDGSARSDGGSDGGGGGAGAGRGWRKELGMRTRWVIGDKEKFGRLLGDLKDFNDGLERLFPPARLGSFQRAWTHQLLESAQQDVGQLCLLETASTGIYPRLEASANLKRLRINLDSKPQSAFRPSLSLKVQRTALSLSPSDKHDSGRSLGRHETAGDVMIEWVDYDVEERASHGRRLDDLARMMHSASERHPDLRGVDCVGYTDDATRTRFGLVYKAPAPAFATLHELLLSSSSSSSSASGRKPSLNERVRLARRLAVALWSLHSLDWLHKSLCASNVLFFFYPTEGGEAEGEGGGEGEGEGEEEEEEEEEEAKKDNHNHNHNHNHMNNNNNSYSYSKDSDESNKPSKPNNNKPATVTEPFLGGFDASRPDLDNAPSLAARKRSIHDTHRHPAAVRGRRHRKAFDIYSLGLILLEVGLWRTVQTVHRPHYTADRWRDRVLLMVPTLASKTGTLFAGVVDACLRVGEDMAGVEAAEMMQMVVTTLESIRV
ncbi:hypothetical protein XA68_17816 [Ophiocordyceps unilateralis]|uniref:Prion-inhibition and propagation HeLo domain-containing protein n=1 Tax=Ophiocordyceps unilateralis TaxID=268505 RepID=A0A2A9P4B0_OPHUN|nr:hypothetical protein XA68_17816 [Ophiocordyceps unilateralis]